jgi:GntR family transcriptional regulator
MACSTRAIHCLRCAKWRPLTVLKGYQELADEQIVETRRGRGMFINAGARRVLLQAERQRFLAEQWPEIYATIRRLGLTPQDLLDAALTGER